MKRWKRWLLAFCAGLVVLGVAAGIYLGSPAPPPKVLVTFQGFAMNGTNRVARICFKNEGKIPVWWDGGFKTMTEHGGVWHGVWYSGISVATMPSSSFVIPARVPDNCARWQAEFGFEYYKHVPIKRRFVERFVFSGKFNIKPNAPLNNALFRAVLWCLDRLPQPKELRGTVTSPWITNAPDTNRLVLGRINQ
jgi:hypothetical protein